MKTYLRTCVLLAMAALQAAAWPAVVLADVVPALPVDYTSVQLRDPFEAYVTKEEAPVSTAQLQEEIVNLPELNVQGISWGARFPQAIVNNRVLREGSEIEGAQVVQIKNNAIIFRFKNREFTLASPAAGTVTGSEGGLK